MASRSQGNEDAYCGNTDSKTHRLQESSGGRLLAGAGAQPNGAQTAASLKTPGHLHRHSAAENLDTLL